MIGITGLIKFDEKGFIPVVTQDYETGEVLMVAYMNNEALLKSMETGMAHYWSRSRGELWLKGETSGNYQYIKSMHIDCDEDTLLLKVEQKGGACHTGHYSCFYRQIYGEDKKTSSYAPSVDKNVYAGKAGILQELYDIIVDRTINPKEGSYTNYLFEKGLDKILKKVGEEAAEVIIAAKNISKDEVRYEIADLFYHIFVLMVERDLTPDDIYDELRRRR